MKIGIDARMYGPRVGGGGLGRYIEELVTKLQAIDHQNRYILFLKKENFDACKITNPNFEKRLADIHWYTLKEQFLFGKIVDQEKLDLIHCPHWNIPVFLKTPFVVTIHDLILLEEPRSANMTTRNTFIFFLKYIGYKIVLAHAIYSAKKIITVSHTTAASIKKFFPKVESEKIEVVYEGVTPLVSDPTHTLPFARGGITRYLLYVGNAYPHKNLNRLIAAFKIFHKSHPDVHLILAGRESIFYERLQAGSWDPTHNIFVKNPSDETLAQLFHNASLFIFPSLIEGFGLPPLEAMSFAVPVIASDIPSLREVLGDSAIFFPPDDTEKIARVITDTFENEALKKQLKEKGLEHIKQFSWHKMAQSIKSIYESCDQKNP